MRGSARVGLGVLALLSAVVSASLGAGTIVRSLGGRFDYPAGLAGALTYLQIAGLLLGVAVYFGVWRLAHASRGAGLLFAAFLVSLAMPVFVLVIKALPRPEMIAVPPFAVLAINAASLLGALFFSLGLLLSGLVPRWVAWLGIVGVVVQVPTVLYVSSATNRMLVAAYSANTSLRGVSQVIDLVFLVALGVSLILGLSAGSPASNKGIERTAEGTLT